ncbi:ABC transporter permease [Salinibacterium sp. SWN167]|uniref:ABC transporter permease n=1 Tax=Salinibacterium sp. SWN167 TaxID=2792054 RepID=UPI0018CF12B3|nr:ABC transporter permease [Salinibacterium sp. SWN167]MBH0081888.1 ABC transporter permease [Salinibacterium sp. SWN167]
MKNFDFALLGTRAVQYRLVIMLIAVAVFGGLSLDDFLTVNTLQSVLDRATVVGFLALGLTPVLIAGQIDLSIGSIMSMAGITTIFMQPVIGNVPAAAAGVAVGILIGAVNALMVVVFKINSLVATLATLLIFASLALLLTNSYPLSSEDPIFGLPLTADFLWILTPRSAIFLIAAVLMFVWLKLTPTGRNLYAVGSDASAATSSGIYANGYIAASFVLSGFFAGLAGMMQSLSTAAGSPVAGAVMLIPAITAVVIGGTRLEGGRGSSLATLGGVLALGALTTALEYNGVPSYTQAIYTGLLLILLISLDRIVSGHGGASSRAQRSVRVAPRNTPLPRRTA